MTPQLRGLVVLSLNSTPGRIAHWPARRSRPNQPTTSEADRQFGSARLELVERDEEVGHAERRVDVLGDALAFAQLPADRLGRVDELAGRGDDVDRAQQLLGGLRIGARPDHLEGELRQAVAEALQRQLLEDDVGGAAIGRRVARAFQRLDVRVGQLILGAACARA